MSSSSRPKRETKEPDRFTPWEEGVTSMIGVKVAGSRERKKNKQHMKQYRANKEASKDTEGKEDEVVHWTRSRRRWMLWKWWRRRDRGEEMPKKNPRRN